MQPKSFCFLLLLLWIVMPTRTLVAQEKRTELEKTKKQLEEEINLTNQLLEETKKSKILSLNELNMLQAKIRKRQNLIATLQKQIQNTDSRLQRTRNDLKKTQNELSQLKKEYGKMLVFANKNRNGLNKLMFLFAADDFNQAYRRLKYLQQYSSLRKRQIERMTTAQAQLNNQKTQLEEEKIEKTRLFDDEQKQQVLLSNEQKQVDQTVRKISDQEKKLQKDIRSKEQEALKLQRQIESIIAEEIRKAQNRKTENKTASPDKLSNLTPEEIKLSNSFTQNRGKLPWPVERGIISSRYGEQPHPVLKKVTIKNNGIDIATPAGSEARAVFDGVVVSVNRITPTNNAVILRHGDYFTVYSNLEQTYVKRGDNVSTKQLLGSIHTDKIEGKTVIHFELWQNKNLVNPSLWLAD